APRPMRLHTPCFTVSQSVWSRIGLGAATCFVVGLTVSWSVATPIFILWCLGSLWEVLAFQRFKANMRSSFAHWHMLVSVFSNMCITMLPVLACIMPRDMGLTLTTGLYATGTLIFLSIIFGRYKYLLVAATLPCLLAVMAVTGLLMVDYVVEGRHYMALTMLAIIPVFILTGLMPHLSMRQRDRQLEALVIEAETQRVIAESERRDAQKAKAEADAANLAKSEFLASMSHELRTPMNGIIGMADLMLQSGLTEAQKRYGQIIQSSGENLLVIINDILDFSKLEAREMALHPEAFDLRETVNTVATLVSGRDDRPNVSVKLHVDADLPERFMGDAVRIGQILTNLAGNAMKFTEAGEVIIAVQRARKKGETGPVDPTYEHLLFTVRDTGIGIDPEQIDRMFEKFSQASSGTTRSYGGTGLGLAICKELVELMGGRIGAASQLGVGSTFGFTIKLPVIAEAESQAAA
ncbi:MAG: ATP-binding protein, partial [Pseudomonadota bacterium]